MSENNHSNGKDLLVGAVIGGLVGAITALLLAPKSGKELRSDISEQYNHVSEKTKHIANDIKERSQDIANDVKERTQVIATEVSERTQSIAKEVSQKSQELAGKAKELAANVADEMKSWNEAKKEVVSSDLEDQK